MAKLIIKNGVLKLVVGAAQGPEGIQGPPGSSQPLAKVSEVVSNSVIFRGEATPGSLVSNPVWRIKKITLVLGENPTSKTEWPQGDSGFKFSWDARNTYQYI